MMLVIPAIVTGACRDVATDRFDLSRYGRPLEARLSGSFGYRSCAPAVHDRPAGEWAGCSLPPAASDEGNGTEGSTRRGAEDSVDLSHRAILLGLAQGGDSRKLDQALQRLERLGLREIEPSRRARVQSDVAAIYYSQAAVRGDPSLLLDALERSSRALQLDPELEEALFNRALVLEALSLGRQAHRAWRSYLAVDADSTWGLEAGERLGGLPTHHGFSDPGEALTTLLDEELKGWSAATNTGDVSAASAIAREAARAGAEILEVTRDRFVLELADELAHLDAGTLARAFSAYARGRCAFEAGCYKKWPEAAEAPAGDSCAYHAQELFEQARADLDETGSVLRHWTRIWLAGVALNTGDFDQALDVLEDLEAASEDRGYLALEGRLHWTRGLAFLRLGRHAAAYAEYAEAEAAFLAARHRSDVAAIRMLKAEALTLMGLARESWRERIAAFEHLGWIEAWSWRRHTLLLSAADTAKDLGLELAFRTFGDEAVEYVSTAASMPIAGCRPADDRAPFRVAARLRRAEGLSFFGDEEAAWADLEAAAGDLDRLPAGADREKLAADVALAASRLRPNAEIAGGLTIQGAVDSYRRHGAKTRLVDALVAEARALRLAQRGSEAEASLDQALDLLGTMQRDLAATLPLRGSAHRRAVWTHWEMSQPVHDEQFELRLERGEAVPALLELADRAHTPPGHHRVGEVPGLASARGQVLIYLITPSAVTAWSFTGGHLEGRVLDVSPRELERRTEALISNLEQGVVDEAEAEDLHRILVGWSAHSGTAEEVVVVPDRFLHRLPFAALVDPATGRHFVESASLRIAASLRLSAKASPQARRAETPGTALLVGNPTFDTGLFPWLKPLPGADEEVRRLQRLLASSRVLRGEEATKEAVLGALPGSSILHLAAHTVPSWESGDGDPVLVLAASGGGPLASSVLAPSDLDLLETAAPELVFLSGCRTSPGSRARMQGLHGLAAPFLERGAGAVVATFWEIDDDASVALVERFYRALLDGRDAAQALRDAQVAMIHAEDPAYRSPRTWAAFQLLTNDIRPLISMNGKEKT